ncbi:GntR family transcriptional regulator [Cupriavidus necator]|uniref:GntR family transcriptional regulator n=1 Tax=Cupriavidus necator TaxID=106590 RepID=UPI00339D765B
MATTSKKAAPAAAVKTPRRPASKAAPKPALKPAPKAAPEESAGAESAASEASATEAIYLGLLTAIMEHRLLAGTKLVEERLCEVTGASRARIRQVFARLAHEKLVTLVPNRGAFVSSPTVDEAREVFQARRVVEPALAAELAQRATPAKVRSLRRHAMEEDNARGRGDRAAMIRLSGEFHIVLADMAGNAILEKLIREMVSLTCLIITLYDRPGAPACAEHEHRQLIDAIEQRDAARASALMAEHLQHIEASLDLSMPDSGAPDFYSIFSKA